MAGFEETEEEKGGDRMTAERKSETLIISEHYMAERVRYWGLYRWKIWRIADILDGPKDVDVPVVFCAQSGLDALEMIKTFEEKWPQPEAVA